MKYTKIVAKIYKLMIEYENFEDSKCCGCLAPVENCKECCVTYRKEEIAKEIVEKINEEIKGE